MKIGFAGVLVVSGLGDGRWLIAVRGLEGTIFRVHPCSEMREREGERS